MTDAAAPAMAGTAPSETGRFTIREAAWLLARAFAYVWPMKGRFFAKFMFTVGGMMLPVLVLPWPGKILLDYVVTGKALTPAETATFPPYLQPLVRLMEGASAADIALTTILASAVLVVLIGAFGQGLALQNRATGDLGQGQDTATRTENEANMAETYCSGLYGWAEFCWQLRLSQALNHYYRCKLFERIKALPLTSLEDRRIGDAIFRVMYDTPSITQVCYRLIQRPILSTLNFCVMAAVLTFSFGEAPEVIWLAALVLPVTFFLTAPFTNALRNTSGRARASGADTTASIEEGMSNILAVQSLGGWERERSRFEAASAASFKGYRSFILRFQVMGLAVALGGVAMGAVLFVVISGHIITGAFTVGDYAVLFYYFGNMSGAATNVGRLWIDLQDNAAGLKRVFEVMDLPGEQDLGTEPLPPIRQGVKIEGAGLVYPDGRRALEGVDFEAKVGEIVAIVGPTGAGKTSLAYLIPRFHRPTEGRVLIDGADIDTVRLDSLRSQVTYVFQETHLFSDTLFNNIAYAKPGASRDEVEAVAKTAGAHDFIMALPDGYETDLGSRGGKLSVGQKQRIAIARGLLRDSKVLILDEPTSALDPKTERYLVAALQEAAQDRAVVIIAHRLSTIAQADRIVFLEAGRVIEEGRHAELMARPGSAYAAFVRLQQA